MVGKDVFESTLKDFTSEGVEDYAFWKYLPAGQQKLEGFLFPDTYDFGVKATDRQVINRMLARFDEVFKPEYYTQAEKLGMTPYEIVILASIIEKESAHSDERKIISSVFYNRLNSTDASLKKLQSCATIQYILLEKTGAVKLKITDEDTSIPSTYNTYIHAGLPPKPICSPSEDSILAALYPENTDYLYFVAKGDEEGRNEFSKTYQEHLAARQRYGV